MGKNDVRIAQTTNLETEFSLEELVNVLTQEKTEEAKGLTVQELCNLTGYSERRIRKGLKELKLKNKLGNGRKTSKTINGAKYYQPIYWLITS